MARVIVSADFSSDVWDDPYGRRDTGAFARGDEVPTLREGPVVTTGFDAAPHEPSTCEDR